MIGVITVVVALILLMYLAYRGIKLLIQAPAMAVLAAALGGGVPVLASYTQISVQAKRL